MALRETPELAGMEREHKLDFLTPVRRHKTRGCSVLVGVKSVLNFSNENGR